MTAILKKFKYFLILNFEIMYCHLNLFCIFFCEILKFSMNLAPVFINSIQFFENKTSFAKGKDEEHNKRSS